MLQNLREHVHGWIAALIAGILCLAFALWGIEYYISGSPSQPIVATVDGFEITKDQWDAAYDRGRQSQQIQLGDPALNEIYQNQLKIRVLNGLVQTHVLSQAAQKLGYIISSAQVGAIVQKIPAFQLEGRFSYPLFQRTVQNLSYTPEGFAQEIATSGLLTQVQHSLVESNFALSNEISRYLSLQNQKRDFGYFLISPTVFLPAVVIKKQEIDAYYKVHGREFMQPEEMRIQYLILSTEEANKKITITPQEVAQYYEENKAAFKNARSPKEEMLFAEKALRQHKVEQWIITQSDTLSNLAYTHPDTLKPAANALGLSIQTTGFFTQKGEKTGILSNPKVLAAAFSNTVFKEGNNSDLIALDPHTAMVLRKDIFHPATIQPLKEVQGKIESVLKKQAAQKAAIALGEKIQKALQEGVAPEKLAAQYTLPWVKKYKIGREDRTVSPAVLRFVFNQPAPSESAKKLAVQGTSLPSGEYVVTILASVAIENATGVDLAMQTKWQQKLAKEWGGLEYDLYLAQHMDTAKIKIETGEKK